MKLQRGFTLIELIMVVVILGILSAFALPRFQDFGSNARAASVQGFEGAIRSAAAIARASCLADAGCDQSTNGQTVTLDGVSIAMDYGYPDSTAAGSGIEDAAQISGITPSYPGANVMRIEPTGAITPATCYVTYTEPAAAPNPPAIASDTAGC